MGCRGAAVRTEFVKGQLNLDGEYSDNESEGRGGVFAFNRLYKSGVVNVKGKYQNNVAKEPGGVYSITLSAEGIYASLFDLSIAQLCIINGLEWFVTLVASQHRYTSVYV